MFEPILEGLTNALSMGSILANLMGVALGIIFGALPGLTAAMGVALLIPLTFGMPAIEAFSALLGMYCGAIYGGCITAILVGTPGTVSAAATMLEGPSLTARGESRRALQMATWASFIGGMFSALVLVTVAPLLAKAAMSFGAPEYFAVAVFGLTVVSSLSTGNMLKGMISAFIGLFLATIGLDPITGDLRNTFDNPNLFSGLSLVPVLVGLFAMSQVIVTVEDVFRGVTLKGGNLSSKGLSLRDMKDNVVNFLRSSVIGTLIGIVPATGVSAATFMAYGEAKRFSKHPEMFGKGAIDGIAATESSNNAVCGGALIPLLTLGVPGDIVTAIILGALMIQGLTPGPLLFVEHPVTVYGIFAAFIIANVLMLILGLIAIRGSNKIIAIPSGVLMPIVVTLCAVGGYAVNNNMFDLLIVAIFGVVGYFMIKCDIPQPPMLLAMILAGIAETNFRRALSISQNDYSIFYTSPVAMCILAVSLFVLIKPIYDSIRAALRGENIAEE
ncbi:MAG TPA: tripartite tricarboxylate transporter permease [Candidatus Desulfovibrio gallistercoris]|uniref:tripartite tricarboxylate transporter permease n=1 Tax=uncultured Desulfovibrio sp. TaxID=167968 RepID=UPI001F8B51A7|nr:tripartite tricarboxylate transporter permease [uncultured Desulfovibrio sp.]HJA75390.1 tripartite tricarboxylate transporter permease [Candidatus Desulfovibrio gallistercoris]